jgi:hypothetical protein
VVKSQIVLDKPRRKLSVSLEEATVLKDVLPHHLLEDAFHKDEKLINEPNSITKAASDDDRLRTVKSRYTGVYSYHLRGDIRAVGKKMTLKRKGKKGGQGRREREKGGKRKGGKE